MLEDFCVVLLLHGPPKITASPNYGPQESVLEKLNLISGVCRGFSQIPTLRNTPPFSPPVNLTLRFESVNGIMLSCVGVWPISSRDGGEQGFAAGQLVVGEEGRDLYFVCTLLSCLFRFALFTEKLSTRSSQVYGFLTGEKPP